MSQIIVKMDTLDVALRFGKADAEEQGYFLNSIGWQLYRACATRFDFETQICRIAEKLDRDGKDFIRNLAAFIELEEKKI